MLENQGIDQFWKCLPLKKWIGSSYYQSCEMICFDLYVMIQIFPGNRLLIDIFGKLLYLPSPDKYYNLSRSPINIFLCTVLVTLPRLGQIAYHFDDSRPLQYTPIQSSALTQWRTLIKENKHVVVTLACFWTHTCNVYSALGRHISLCFVS